MKISWLWILLNTAVLQASTKEPTSRCQNGKLKFLNKVLLIGSRCRDKKDARTVRQDELSTTHAGVKKIGHKSPSASRLGKITRSITGTPKAIIVKVNGQKVYNGEGGTPNEKDKPTPSPVLQPAPSSPAPAPLHPETHNINLHINLTKPPSPLTKVYHQPIVISPPPGSVPQLQPQPRPIIAIVPQPVQPPQGQVQPQPAPQVIPVVVAPPTTPTPEKNGESSLKKLLLAAALLKGMGGSQSSEGNSQALPSVLWNPLAPISSTLPQGGRGYPQIATTQLGFPAQVGGLNWPNVGPLNQNLRNPVLGTQNLGYPAMANQNLGYPSGATNMGYPAGGQLNMGYPAGGNPNMGYPAGGNPNTGYPAGGNPNMGYPAGGNTNMGYPAGGNPNMGYPAGGNSNMGYPAGGNTNMGYPAGGNTNMGYPAGGNPNTRYPAGGNPNMGYPAGGNTNVGYPAGGNPNMGYPEGNPPSGKTGMGPLGGRQQDDPSGVNMLPATISNFLSGPPPTPSTVTNQNAGDSPAGNTIPLPGQNTANELTPGEKRPTATSPVAVVPETSPMSSCWCGCEADCAQSCDLCNSSPTNAYSYNTKYTGIDNNSGTMLPDITD
ncbi:PPE family protein PPE10-like [Montipora foliosa]|uniref:PPE family protein PPE10-like n=1 Tax=Montipora foliosa TaxID=591990 RepID=UPI0035F19745